jgi:hypothetical protein
LEEFSPIKGVYPQFFASYPQPWAAADLLHGIRGTLYMGCNLKPWAASKERGHSGFRVTTGSPNNNMEEELIDGNDD